MTRRFESSLSHGTVPRRLGGGAAGPRRSRLPGPLPMPAWNRSLRLRAITGGLTVSCLRRLGGAGAGPGRRLSATVTIICSIESESDSQAAVTATVSLTEQAAVDCDSGLQSIISYRLCRVQVTGPGSPCRRARAAAGRRLRANGRAVTAIIKPAVQRSCDLCISAADIKPDEHIWSVNLLMSGAGITHHSQGLGSGPSQ